MGMQKSAECIVARTTRVKARTSMQREDANPRFEMIEPDLNGTGRKPEVKGEDVSSCTAGRDSTDLMSHQLLEAVGESESMQAG